MGRKPRKITITRGNWIKGLACILFGHNWQTVKTNDLKISECKRCGMKIYYKLLASILDSEG